MSCKHMEYTKYENYLIYYRPNSNPNFKSKVFIFGVHNTNYHLIDFCKFYCTRKINIELI